jgi:single-strand DNA-binding protein
VLQRFRGELTMLDGAAGGRGQAGGAAEGGYDEGGYNEMPRAAASPIGGGPGRGRSNADLDDEIPF